jgi:hypothetical protein
MESKKDLSSEPGKSSTGNPSTTPTSPSPTSSSTTGNIGSPTSSPASGNYSSGSSNPGSGQNNPTTGSAPQRAREQQSGTGQSPIDQTKQVVTDAYGKTSEALTNTYDQAMTFGREHPGQLTLIAFGAGIGIGLLLASSFSSGRSTSQRYAEPVVSALSNVALEFFRNR